MLITIRRLQGSQILNGLKQTKLLSVHGVPSLCGACFKGVEAGCQSKYIPKPLNFSSPSHSTFLVR